MSSLAVPKFCSTLCVAQFNTPDNSLFYTAFLLLCNLETPSPVIVVLGPTGAGKSDLSLALAETFAGEVVNCDSVQIYRGLDIGSAKLAPAARRNIPHHLIDIAEVTDHFTAGDYARMARGVLNDIISRGKLPIVAGGTGFYLRALFEGLSPAPPRDESLRDRLRGLSERRPAALHRVLKRIDPLAASRIHPNDHQKLIRAIEMTVAAQQPASTTQSQPREALQNWRALKIGLHPPRAALYAKLNQRSAMMFEDGIVEETRRILSRGFPEPPRALESLGYKQALRLISESTTVAEAIAECQAKTRQYAKRQLTWFRREHDVHWLEGFGGDSPIQQAAAAMTRDFLRSHMTNV